MGKIAYLLLLCQMTDKPPFITFLGAGVYSEKHPTTVRGCLYLYLAEASGPDYEKARENVLHKAKKMWGEDWIKGIQSADIGVIR